MKDLDTFERAYLTCALWSSTDNSTDQGGEPLDKNYSIEDLPTETIDKAIADCKKFRIRAESQLEGLDDERCGHDFWLTRNHHGAGFWDRGYPKMQGDALTRIAHSLGEVDLYIGDDGEVYQS